MGFFFQLVSEIRGNQNHKKETALFCIPLLPPKVVGVSISRLLPDPCYHHAISKHFWTETPLWSVQSCLPDELITNSEENCQVIHLRMRFITLCCYLVFWVNTGYVSANPIIATVGTYVTLRCKYDAGYYGRLPFCWGRGHIPNSGCGNEVIKSDGTKLLSRLSERYFLTGDLAVGEAFLTIKEVQESDSGIYGCRIDIPGWFNDQIYEVTLTVNPGRPFPIKVETREVRERTLTVRWTPPFDGGRPITAYKVALKYKYASWDTAKITEVAQTHLIQVTLVDLHPAKTYNLRMFAVNSVGMSEASNVLIFTTKEAAPEGPPVDVQLQALSSYSIKVIWKPPNVELRNGVLHSYIISYREYDRVALQFQKLQQLSVSATREEESTILTNLNPSTQYSVLVQAKTNAGAGPASTTSFCSTLDEVKETTPATTLLSSTAASTKVMQTTTLTNAHTTSTGTISTSTVWESTHLTTVPPDPPVVGLKEVIDNIISLFWTPGFEGNSPITGFYLEYKAANASWDYTKAIVDFSSNETDATIIEINPSTYNIRMFAKNSMGTSKASNVLIVTIEDRGQQQSNFSTTVSTITQSSAIVENRGGVHTAAIIVPIVLMLSIGAFIMVWQLRRIKQRSGSLNMWLTNGAIYYKDSEPLQEL
ncbi:Down syndrome cell adhesion molecule-like isoform X2 [Girardinichthys multiradiatus]|uniref:Down syndrome cell adhesion molecule-like isoform X2 n=1 Tax=Girardinichthys multiradiatus TaxID=208333 RepID=UPI001FAC4EDE|nr:Down syndrome cell adhesion molecule-like isoform X2 [Girardinichthys multiradiatus]